MGKKTKTVTLHTQCFYVVKDGQGKYLTRTGKYSTMLKKAEVFWNLHCAVTSYKYTDKPTFAIKVRETKTLSEV